MRPAVTDQPIRVGFFGKLPSRGDFVRSGLSRATVEAWDQWLQTVVPLAADTLADRWWDMRSWRFAFGANICGPWPMTGLFLPSADRVGRLFPLLIAVEGGGIRARSSEVGATSDVNRPLNQTKLGPDGFNLKLSGPGARSSDVGATSDVNRPLKQSSAFLDEMESIATVATRSIMPPETLARRLDAVTWPPQHTPTDEPSHARWWRHAVAGKIEAVWASTLPSADTFLSMVTP